MRRNSLPNLLIVLGQRSERLARDFHDRVVEILGFARPVDSLACESDHDSRHRRIFEQYLCRLLAVVLVGCDERVSTHPRPPLVASPHSA